MKKFVTIIVITLLAIPTFAQTLRFGVRGGYDFIDQTVNKDILNASNRTGFHIGPTLDINIPALPFAIDVSTLYTQQNIKTNNSDYTVEKAYFLDVPVNLKYTIGLGSVGLVLSAGPYARFNLDGGNIDFNKLQHTYQSQTFQAGANFGVGVNLSKNFYVKVAYYTSLTDNYKETDANFDQVFRKKPDRMVLAGTYYF